VCKRKGKTVGYFPRKVVVRWEEINLIASNT
jgi:hypothetical protein